jgi:hypothetical protein
VTAKFREWAELYGGPPAGPDWDPWRARNLHDEARARRFEVGDWPCTSSVYEVFGSWGAAMIAAGFEPRAPHGGAGNQFRMRSMRERTAA